MDILSNTWLENSIREYLIAFTITLFSTALILIIRKLTIVRLQPLVENTNTQLDDLATNIIRNTRSWFIIGLSLYFGIQYLKLTESLHDIIGSIIFLIVLIQISVWSNQLINFILHQYTLKTIESNPNTNSSVSIIKIACRTILWTVLILLALDNLGIEITGLITGLGIGGIAVALAVQNILSDILAYLSIMLDRPFAIGDFIVVGEFTGLVENIGIKTTRLRSLSGELVIFSNNDLLNSRMRNFKDRQQRRILFQVGVKYDTDTDLLSSIPKIIEEIINKQENIEFDRAHLTEFGPFSINFEIVYYVTTADYMVYMDAQHKVNLEIIKAFENHQIEFAFPTQTLHVYSETE